MLIEKFRQAGKEIAATAPRRLVGRRETLVDKLAKFKTIPPPPRYIAKPKSVVGKKLIGQMLADAGVISRGQLARALVAQRKSTKRLGLVLIEMGYASEEVVLDYLSDQIAEIIKEYEKMGTELLPKKQEDFSRYPIRAEKKLFFFLPEEKTEIKRRIYAGQKNLQMAKNLFHKENFSEAINRASYAAYHARQVAQFLPQHKVPAELRGLNTKSVYTGYAGPTYVRKYQVIYTPPADKSTPPTRQSAKLILSNAERYINYIEKIATQEILEKE